MTVKVHWGICTALTVLLLVGTQVASANVPATIRQGAAGPTVVEVQEGLRQLGYDIVADGVFGPRTAAAVRAFQGANGLTSDGVVGELTWGKLSEAIARSKSTYVVVRGDTLAKIATRLGTTVRALAELNGLRNPDLIRVGDRLLVPGASDDAGAASTETTESPDTPTPPPEGSSSAGTRQAGQDLNLFSRGPRPEAAAGAWPVALTFDDGPDPIYTVKLMGILAQFGAKATFFVVGQDVQIYPTIVKELAGQGHQVENHSFSHRSLLGLPHAQVQLEVTRTSELVEALTGTPTRFFRPPLGLFNDSTMIALETTGHDLVLWNNIGGGDTGLQAPEEFVQATTNRLFPGAILMLHVSEATVDVLPDLIDSLYRAGYDLVTLDDMLATMKADQAD